MKVLLKINSQMTRFDEVTPGQVFSLHDMNTDELFMKIHTGYLLNDKFNAVAINNGTPTVVTYTYVYVVKDSFIKE